MAKIGERAMLRVVREKPFGCYLEGGELGEVLLPRREVPAGTTPGQTLEVFLYRDSDDRPVATLRRPAAMPGEFALLPCVAVTQVGAFLDWGLPKQVLVPFREQKSRMEPGRSYLVHLHVDPETGRIVASTRLTRYLDRTPPAYRVGDPVELMVFAKTTLGYKAIINGTHSGLLFHDRVFQPLRPGERTTGYIAGFRDDGKIDLTLHPPGRRRVADLQQQILTELRARGGFWPIGDHSSAEEIHNELGVSKRTFKQTLGAMLKQGLIRIEHQGIRLV